MTDLVTATLAETQTVVSAFKNGKSWRDLAELVGVKHATLHAIGTGNWEHVAWDTVRHVRQCFGLPDPGALTVALTCPDCGQVHTGRCHGRPVVSVAVLAPGEQVAAAERIAGDGERIVRRHRPVQRWRDMSVTELARALRERRVMGREE